VPSLRFLRDDQELLRHRLRDATTRVGRSDECDVALPSEVVSRVHAVFDRIDGAWWVTDKSRHGTRLNGERITRHVELDGQRLLAAPLRPGDVLQVGEYAVVFTEADEEVSATRETLTADHEELVATSEGAVTTRRVLLKGVDGVAQGLLFELTQAVGTLGGRGATVVVDSQLPADAARFRVTRGRMTIDRGAVPVWLEAQPVSAPTPVWDHDIIRIGRATLEAASVVGAPKASARQVGFGEMVGSSEPMTRLFDVLDRMSRHEAPVLLTGESGTGKELAARAIHDHGRRAAKPFVAINCAAIPQNLAEAQLFGYEKGAFTGADQRRDGAFHRAHRGTLFLDELGEMTIDGQARLLRALESGEVTRVGATTPEYLDVRVVAATNRSLPKMVEEGTFRRDLFYRLAVLTTKLPPLRERIQDIPHLVQTLIQRDHPGVKVTPEALDELKTYAWPGNVRELRNVLTRGVVLGGNPVRVEHLQFQPWAFDDTPVVEDDDGSESEKQSLIDLLRRVQGNKAAAARALGIPRSSLLYKMMKFGLEP